MGVKREPGQVCGCRDGSGEGEMEDGRGREGVGRNSPGWWEQSPPRKMKVGGEVVVRQRAQRWPIACCGWPSVKRPGS